MTNWTSPVIMVTIKCNCGRTHPSFEDWQKCPMALTPRPLEPWRRADGERLIQEDGK